MTVRMKFCAILLSFVLPARATKSKTFGKKQAEIALMFFKLANDMINIILDMLKSMRKV